MSWFNDFLNTGLKNIQDSTTSIDTAPPHIRGDQSTGLGHDAPHVSKQIAFNNPYRGSEMHGVQPTGDQYTKSADEWDFYSPAEEPAPHLPDPIAVKIVDESPRELRGFRAYQTTVNAQPSTIATKQPRRKKLAIQNMSATVTVFIGQGVNVNAFEGWPILPGAIYSFEQVERAVWGVSADGSQVQIAVIQEHVEELHN